MIIAGGALASVALLAYLLWPSGTPVSVAEVERRTVREFVMEEAETVLDTVAVLDMPFTGTLEPIAVREGDRVARGEAVARVETFDLRQQLRELEARIAEARARIEGVDEAKPKPERIQSARVRIAEMEDALAMAERQRRIAEVAHEEAASDWARYQELEDDGVVSRSRYEQAQQRYLASREELERMTINVRASEKALEQATLALEQVVASVDDNEYLRRVHEASIVSYEARAAMLRADLEDAELASPVDGVVLTRHFDDRRVVSAGTPVLEVGDLDSIEVQADILSEEVVRVHEGDPVEITGRAVRDKTLPGTVARIYPSGFEKISALGIEQQRVRVRIGFDNAEARLRPGMRVDVRVITGSSDDALAVPERALFRHQEGWAVFMVEDGTARLTPVRLGLRNDRWAEIAEGLAQGDRVITEPGNDLEDGATVTPSE
jgi:HlyD family secretion protein